VRNGSGVVKGGQEGLDQGQEAGEQTVCGSHWAQKEQEYMGDEDNVDQAKEEDNGVVALG
jgi:hypothetical protein